MESIYTENTKLIANLEKHVDLTLAERDKILTVFESKSFSKGDLILGQGDASQLLYFVISGILRAYHVNKDGKETTVMFAKSDWWITDMPAFLNKSPAIVNIQAVENTSCLFLSKTALEELLAKVPKFNTFFRILMQNAYCREQLRNIETLSLPASERYRLFRKKYPEISASVTQKQIASFLGITPEFLSTIRGIKD